MKVGPASKHPYVVSILIPAPGDDPRSRSLKGVCPQNNTPYVVAKGAKLLSDKHTETLVPDWGDSAFSRDKGSLDPHPWQARSGRSYGWLPSADMCQESGIKVFGLKVWGLGI